MSDSVSLSDEVGEQITALAEPQNSFHFLADALPQQVWTALPDGSLDYVNKVVVRYFDRPAAQLIGAKWQSVIHEDDLASCLARWTDALVTGTPYEVEFRLLRADGQYRWHLGRALAQRDERDNIVKWYGTNTDVHDQKEAEKKLRDQTRALEASAQEKSRLRRAAERSFKERARAEAQLAAHERAEAIIKSSQDLLAGVLRGSLDGIMVLEAVRNEEGAIIDFKCLLANPKSAEFLQMDSSDLVGRHLLDVLPEHDRSPLHEEYIKVVETGEPLTDEIEYEAEGKLHWLQVAAVKLGDGFAVTFREITERKLAEAQLRITSSLVRLQKQVADAANESQTIDEVLRATVREVCDYTGWPVGHAFLTEGTGQNQYMQSSDIWHITDPERFAAFKEQSISLVFGVGLGLPGQVLEEKGPLWISNLALEESFDRKATALEAGLRAAFAFPVLHQQNVVAVLEFFTEVAQPPDKRLMEIGMQINRQLLQVFKRVAAEEALRERQQQLAEAQHIARIGSWKWDVETGDLTWSDEMYRIYGREPGTPITYEDFINHTHPDDQERVQRIVQEALRKKQPFNYYHRVFRLDGVERVLRGVGTMHLNNGGEVAQMSGVGHDVTEAYNAEAELALRAERTRMLYEITSQTARDINATIGKVLELSTNVLGMEMAIVSRVVEESYTVEACHAPGTDLVPGTTFELGTTYCSITLGAKDLVAIQRMGASVHQGHPCYKHFELESYIGIPILINGTVYGTLNFSRSEPRKKPFSEADKDFIRLLGPWIASAIKRKHAEQVLTRINETLAQRNRELQDFAYVASHDLQEPLRKVRAFASLFREDYQDKIDETGQFYMERIEDAAARMSQLISDLLAYSRVATRARPFEQVDLNEVIRDVLSDLELQISDAEASVTVKTLPSIQADVVQMRQLLQNLIGNAIKFSKEGVRPAVEVQATIERSTALSETETDICRLSISDNGIGFDEKYMDRIFTPFERLHGRNAYAGTGMGLAICRRIVERHQGKILVDSVPGTGTTFTILLPVQSSHFQPDSETING